MNKQTKNKAEKVNNEAEVLKAQLARILADYDNLAKRVERERGEVQKVVSLRLILKLISVLDGLEAAQNHLKDAGLAISIGEFKKVLSEEGLSEIRPKIGEKFDHNTMEAVEVVKKKNDNNNDSIKDGTVGELILVGWRYSDGTVVRHAKVKVESSN